uniref:ATP-dependent RNA helicase DOB1 n=1 Tax=Syphacia muris TaxID=451379 RepID=A0A158R3R5_9BILA
MSDDDAFDAFNDDSPPPDNINIQQTSGDRMADLEHAKMEEARARSLQFLESLAGTSNGASNAGDTSPSSNAQHKRVAKDPLKDVDYLDDENKRHKQDDDDDVDESQIFSGVEKHKRNSIYALATQGNCSHDVVVPADQEYIPLRPRSTEAAKSYPFMLDAFQKEAINCIDNLESVLVSAHTSAGKTVVALYAIAMGLRDKQRVIYTSPIKALSNQKFRELQEEFSDVGLMTGDVTLNSQASVLVMTTEILRSMLYRGSEIMREVGWVIFDEIHYMRNKERGVVWEETIILLPDSVHYVFLSATIPNGRQFADWVVFLHHQPVHVICTDYRPTPLQHLLFPAGGSGLYEVVNINGKFQEDKFAEAMSFLQKVGDAGGNGTITKKGRGTSGPSDVVKIIRTIYERNMIPCIVFSFSRRECEAYATQLTDMDFNDEQSKKLVKEIYLNAISLLSDEDRKLVQIGRVLPFLLRGIGVHHSGLLPIIKEVIEILFGEGLIKVLFATETFSMGLNMPARTVVFTSARKFDGRDYRWITSGEYIQMSGRAGRRGKDDRGLVILMVDQQMGQDVAKQIIKGSADPINSQFRLTYNMVLNLLRVEGVNPEFMLERSFYQFQNYDALPELYKRMHKKTKEYNGFKIEREHELKGYYQMERQIEEFSISIRDVITKPAHIVPFFQSGRLIKIATSGKDFGWGALLQYHKKPNPQEPLSPNMLYILDVAISFSPESIKDIKNVSQLMPTRPGENGVVEIVPMTIDCIAEISSARIKLPQSLKSFEAKQSVGRCIREVLKRFNGVLPSLDPLNDMKIKDKNLEENIKKLELLETRKKEHPLNYSTYALFSELPDFPKLYQQYKKKLELEAELKQAKEELKKAKSLLQLDELACRKRVLRRLQYCDENDVITPKGRVACEISSADELMLTEMLFSGIFTELKPEHMTALLSCFVFEEKAPNAKLADELSGCLRKMQEFAKRIAKLTIESKLDIDEEQYVESFKPQLMDVVYEWCSGASFAQISQKTEIFEGSIIRCMRRLEELLREMVNASKAMGNRDVEAKFEEGRVKLKRDIVFTASLYL